MLLIFVVSLRRHAILLCYFAILAGAHNEKREGGGGKEHEAPTHLIENLKLTHAARNTKNRQNHKVCSSP